MLWTAQLPAVQLSDDQRFNTYTIWREVKRAYPSRSSALALAMVVNAWDESRIENVCRTDAENSCGLFQLNAGGNDVARALAAEDPDGRLNPAKNTRGIIELLEQTGGEVFAALDRNATVAEIAGIFRRDVERPADRYAAAEATERSAQTIYPTYWNVRADDLPSLIWVWVPPSAGQIALAAAVAAGGLYYMKVKK